PTRSFISPTQASILYSKEWLISPKNLCGRRGRRLNTSRNGLLLHRGRRWTAKLTCAPVVFSVRSCAHRRAKTSPTSDVTWKFSRIRGSSGPMLLLQDIGRQTSNSTTVVGFPLPQ